MKVSIITVTYNSEMFLKSCIDSIIMQDYPNIEYIIVDGASSDTTVSIIKSYGGKVTNFVSEKDNGLYDAMNRGIRMATGDVVGILNSDDFYCSKNVISMVVERFQKTQCDAVYGDLYYVATHNTDKILRKWISGNFERSKFLFGWMPPHPTFFVKRVLFDKFGSFNLSLKSAADYELMLRFLFKNRISAAYVPQFFIKMRAGGISNASWRNRLRANREDRKAWKLNEISPYFFTLWLKPLRKISQYFVFKLM